MLLFDNIELLTYNVFVRYVSGDNIMDYVTIIVSMYVWLFVSLHSWVEWFVCACAHVRMCVCVCMCSVISLTTELFIPKLQLS